MQLDSIARSLDVSWIWPRLWQGAKPPTGPTLRDIGFGVLVLCASEFQPSSAAFPGVRVVHAPMEDSELDKAQLAQARSAARHATYAIDQRRRVLVTCNAGCNRSGLVVALTLLELGAAATGTEALERVRRFRSGSLFNESFASYLRALR